MVKDIIQIGNSKLLEKSTAIKPNEIKSKEVQDLAADLIDTVKFHEGSAAGLSGVQIGVMKQICVVKEFDSKGSATEKFLVLINPKLLKASDSKSIEWEGCMSIASGKQRIYGPVERSREVEVEYVNLKGQKQTLVAKNFFSHLIQHELDHLNGILFLKYVKNPKNIWKEDELDSYLEQYKKFPAII